MLRWKSSLKPAAAAASGIVIEEYSVAGGTTSANTASVTLPTTINSGDLLVMMFYGQGTGTVTTPTGWTNEGGRITDSAGIGYIFWKSATGSEGSSVTVNKSNYAPWSSSVARITGASASPFDVATTTNSGASSTQNLPAITSVTDNCLILRASGVYTGDSNPTPESGYTNGGLSTAGSPRTVFTSKILETAGTEAVYNFTSGGYMQFCHFSMAIKPAGGGYLIDENFDDNLLPSDWTFTSNAGNSYTISGGILYAVNGSDYVTFDVLSAMQDEFWMYARIDGAGGHFSKTSYQDMFEVLDSSNAEFIQGLFYGTSAGFYRLDGATTATSQMVSLSNTAYYLWFHFVKNGTSELWISQSSTKPTTDSSTECVISCSTANTSAAKLRLRLGWANGTRPLKWDFFIGDDADTTGGYLIEENFEGNYSASNPTGWTIEGTPTTEVDFDSTVNVLEGTQSLFITDNTAKAVASFAAQSEVWAYCMWSIGWRNSFNDIISFRDSGGTLLMSLEIINVGSPHVRLSVNGTTSDSLNVLAVDDVVHVWLHWVSGGTCELFLSDNDTRPTTDTSTSTYVTGTGSTADAVDLYFRSPSNRQTDIDKVRVSASEIGSSPA